MFVNWYPRVNKYLIFTQIPVDFQFKSIVIHLCKFYQLLANIVIIMNFVTKCCITVFLYILIESVL